MAHRRTPLLKRIRRSIRHEFRRIRDEHRHHGYQPHQAPWPVRLRHWFRRLKEGGFRLKRRRRQGPHLPPVRVRMRRFMREQSSKYGVLFTRRYLVIALNSTVIFLLSFMLVHLLTHLATGFSSWISDISTTLYYTMVDFHIRYWNWTEEMVILVFSIPALFALLVALLCSIPFIRKMKRPALFSRLRYFTRKQRHRHHRERKKKLLEEQVKRMHGETPRAERRRIARLPWTVRLFLLWTMYHCFTYFFSGMLFAFLFHRRFGYVIWYAFNNNLFELFFAAVAFLSMITIGYVFAAQFFYSARMYLTGLTDRNRLPFVISQALVPFAIGTAVTIVMQLPKFDPSLVLLNFAMLFLLLPLPSRAIRFDNLHFDREEKPARIAWRWILLSAVVITGILVALKIGIPITRSGSPY